MYSGNKGEWSEFYAFIKILSDRELVAANEDLTPNHDNSYGVLRVLRSDDKISCTYDLSDEENILLTTRSLKGRESTSIKPSYWKMLKKQVYQGRDSPLYLCVFWNHRVCARILQSFPHHVNRLLHLSLLC